MCFGPILITELIVVYAGRVFAATNTVLVYVQQIAGLLYIKRWRSVFVKSIRDPTLLLTIVFKLIITFCTFRYLPLTNGQQKLESCKNEKGFAYQITKCKKVSVLLQINITGIAKAGQCFPFTYLRIVYRDIGWFGNYQSFQFSGKVLHFYYCCFQSTKIFDSSFVLLTILIKNQLFYQDVKLLILASENDKIPPGFICCIH